MSYLYQKSLPVPDVEYGVETATITVTATVYVTKTAYVTHTATVTQVVSARTATVTVTTFYSLLGVSIIVMVRVYLRNF